MRVHICKVMHCMCCSVCLTPQDSMLDCMLVKEQLEDVGGREEENVWDYGDMRFSSQYFDNSVLRGN